MPVDVTRGDRHNEKTAHRVQDGERFVLTKRRLGGCISRPEHPYFMQPPSAGQGGIAS